MPEKASFEERVKQVARWIHDAAKVVVFTGAGISTESGLPDYRGPDGVWTRRDKGLAPKPWHEFEPNRGHLAIVELQKIGKLDLLISQNVDNLHLKSGIEPERIVELHGNGFLLYCLKCGKKIQKSNAGWDDTKHGHGYRTEREFPNRPRCACGGKLMSTVVNFGDPMPVKEMERAQRTCRGSPSIRERNWS
jgi:NAD-dependent SIR2 family protein deacetylase